MTTPQHILAIETSNPSAGPPAVAVGVLSNPSAEPLAVEQLRTHDRRCDDLMPAIDRACSDAGIVPASIARIAVSVGPGGYTALRIAVTVAKLIAEATGAQTVAVPTAHIAAAALAIDRLPALICLASKRNAAAASIASDQGVRPLGIITADDLAALSFNTLVADRFAPEPIRAWAAGHGIDIIDPVLTATACLQLGARLDPTDPAALCPIYAREPDAVTQWQARHAT